MEKDDEVSGEGNSYTTPFRQYDPRLGRWKSLDPLAGKYASVSPYVGMGNNPNFYTDPLGLEPNRGDKGSKANPGDKLRRAWRNFKGKFSKGRVQVEKGNFRDKWQGFLSKTNNLINKSLDIGYNIGQKVGSGIRKMSRSIRNTFGGWKLKLRPWGNLNIRIGPISIQSRKHRGTTRIGFPFHIEYTPNFLGANIPSLYIPYPSFLVGWKNFGLPIPLLIGAPPQVSTAVTGTGGVYRSLLTSFRLFGILLYNNQPVPDSHFIAGGGNVLGFRRTLMRPGYGINIVFGRGGPTNIITNSRIGSSSASTVLWLTWMPRIFRINIPYPTFRFLTWDRLTIIP